MEEINIDNNYSLENMSLNSNTKKNDFNNLNYNSIFNFKNSINNSNNNNNININNNNDNNLNFVPKLRPSKNNSKLKKFKLCIKDFGISNYKCDRVTINFVNEYETDRIDCLSCPENDDEEYEKCDTQQNSEGNNNNEKFDFSEIRKEMKSFKKIIHFDNNYNEAENVLVFENNIIYENNNNCFNNNNNKNENNKINEKENLNNNNKNKIEEFDLISQLIKQEIEERNKKIKSFKIPYKRMIDLKLNNENNFKYNYSRKKTIDKKFLNEFNKKKKNISIFNIVKKVNNFRKLEKNKN